VPSTNSNVVETYTLVKQQLPTTTTAESFLSSHQMAVAQMAIEYCSAMVDDSSLRAQFFPAFNFSASVSAAFDAAGTAAIVDPLFSNVVGSGFAHQPNEAQMKAELSDLITVLRSRHSSGNASDTQTIVKATCAAALGSAAVLIQ
jgi:hypothetical protein